MLAYYFKLGVKSLRRNPVLTGLMVLILAVGVAASMATLTVLYVMGSDPIPHRSGQLFVPIMDNSSMTGFVEGDDPPEQMSYRDAVALKQDAPATRQTALYGLAGVVEGGRSDIAAAMSDGVAVHADFFAMFDVPFREGAAWSADDDARSARVAVLSHRLADRLFGDQDALGRSIRIGGAEFVVSGVIQDWRPLPKFYRLVGGSRLAHEDFFLPLETAVALEMDPQGSVDCNTDTGLEPGFAGLTRSDCVWIQMWAELPTASDRQAYTDFMAGYVEAQKALGRFPRPMNNRLHPLREWLEVQQVVSNDSRLQTWLAFGFLLVCLVNTIGLMLAKFTARAGEIGVRRALGAPRLELFKQYITEAAVVGLAGAALGLLATLGCLWLIGRQSPQLEAAARMDWVMLVATVVLAVGASILAGLLPTWRACQVTPAVQLKSQ